LVAGESAQRVAQKRREKAARLNRVADAYDKGAEGERRTAHALVELPVADWFVLHDVRWPGKRFANIDHVVIGPGGVFVIDSKAWSGALEVRDGVLRQNGYQRESAVASAADAAMAVAEQVPGLDQRTVSPVLCFAGDQGVEGHTRGVILCTPGTLVAMLRSRPRVLDDRTVRRTLLGLQESLKAAAAAPVAPRRLTLKQPRSGSRRTTRRMGARLLAFVVTMGLLLVGVHELPRLPVSLSQGIASSVTKAPRDAAHARSLGRSVTLPAATGRPPLRVTVDRVVTARRVGTLPYLFDGNRFFAVRVEVRNLGVRGWVSQPGSTAQVVDSSNTPIRSEGAMRIREGRVLPDTLRVAPGRTARGYVVFQLRRTDPVTGFSLTVGPGKPRTATWSIDRQ
jgi:hypothetical protein